MPMSEAEYAALLTRNPALREVSAQRHSQATATPTPSVALHAPPVVVTLTLPYPPSLNHAWRHVGTRTLLSAAGRAYRRTIATAVLAKWPHAVPRPLVGRLAVQTTIHAPDHRARDLDNVFKAVGDALQHAGVYMNDSQIDDLHVLRGAVTPRQGSIVVQITQITERANV